MSDTASSEAVRPEADERGRSTLRAAIRQAWWLGLGALATVGEQTARVAEALIEKGRKVEPSVLEPVRRAASGLSSAREGAGSRLWRAAGGVSDVRVPAGFRRAAGPTTEEFEKLVEEVKNLRARVAEKTGEAADRG